MAGGGSQEHPQPGLHALWLRSHTLPLQDVCSSRTARRLCQDNAEVQGGPPGGIPRWEGGHGLHAIPSSQGVAPILLHSPAGPRFQQGGHFHAQRIQLSGVAPCFPSTFVLVHNVRGNHFELLVSAIGTGCQKSEMVSRNCDTYVE